MTIKSNSFRHEGVALLETSTTRFQEVLVRHMLRLRRFRFLPTTWWVCASLIAISAALLVANAIQTSQTSAKRLGGLVTVFIANNDIEAGEVIEPSDVAEARWPRALLPQSPIAMTPVGMRTTTTILGAEPIVVAKLAPAGLSQVAALLQPGDRAIDIPNESHTPNVAVGDVVDIVAANANAPARLVAESAKVVDISEASTTIAVSQFAMTGVAESLAGGLVTLAVVGANR